jgi:hypothetical protein
MERLRQQLDNISSSAQVSIDQAASAGSAALNSLQAQHSSYTNSAAQVRASPALVAPDFRVRVHATMHPRSCPW